jgi:hypothetical protein
MARPERKQETKSLEISVPIALYEHLTYLASQSHMGATETAVALYLITSQIDERERLGLTKPLTRIPTVAPGQ